jgi:hypothetical protein
MTRAEERAFAGIEVIERMRDADMRMVGISLDLNWKTR